MAIDFDFTDDARSLQVPSLIMAADADMAPPSHYVEFLQAAGRRFARWRLDERGQAKGRPCAGHLAGVDALQRFHVPLFATTALASLDA
jgi:hypothetical protein